MSQNTSEVDLSMVSCPRDQEVETNLRCSHCGMPICPRCMVYAPVGSKCPECASIGGPEMFKVGQSDLIRTGLLGGVGAIVIGVAIAVVAVALWSLELLSGIPGNVWLIVVGMAQFGGALAVSQAMIYFGGRKYSTSLRVLAGALSLVFYVAEVLAIDFIAVAIPAAGAGPGIVVNIGGLIGFAFGTYYAMSRFKP